MATPGTPQQRRTLAALDDLLRRELGTALDSTRDALLQQEAAHHAALMARLDSIQATLNALATGQIQIGIQGMAFFGGNSITAVANPPAHQVHVSF